MCAGCRTTVSIAHTWATDVAEVVVAEVAEVGGATATMANQMVRATVDLGSQLQSTTLFVSSSARLSRR